jgi:uncharacterized protein (DUF58 family)
MLEPAHHSRRYLDPAVLARIRGLELRARLIVEGFFSGMHHSPQRGISVEFSDHRAYVQGDDIRHIDWKVFAKTDKFYIKEFEQETNLELMLVVDGSESMQFRSPAAAMSKHEYASALAAAIAYLALQQHDSVGLALFDDHLSTFIRPSNNPQHWKILVHEFEQQRGAAPTIVGRSLSELAERLTHRTMIILVSDLFDEPAAILRGLRHLLFRRHETVVWNIWDPAELSFPFHGPTLFDGMEDTGRLLAEPASLRRRYMDEVKRFQTALRAGCGRMNFDYVVFDTATPLDVALSTYLATRSTRIRRRSSRVRRR